MDQVVDVENIIMAVKLQTLEMQVVLVHLKEILEVLDKYHLQLMLEAEVVEQAVLEEMDLHQVLVDLVDLDHLLPLYLDAHLNLIMDQQE